MQDFEFIIVDNGSTDHSGQIADQYSKLDSRIRVVHRSRGSIGAGRNAGLDICRGSYIAFVDDDDWIDPDYLEFLYDLLIEENADMSICGTTKAFSEKKYTMSAEEAVIQTMWRKLFKLGFPGKLFRRELIEGLRFPEDTVHEDCFLIDRVLGNAQRVAYDGTIKYHIFHGPTSTTKWKDDFRLMTPKILEELIRSRKLRTEWCSERFPDSAALFRYFEWSFMLSMVEKIKRLRIVQCNQDAEVMIQELSANKNEFLCCGYCQDFERQWMEQYVGKHKKEQG